MAALRDIALLGVGLWAVSELMKEDDGASNYGNGQPIQLSQQQIMKMTLILAILASEVYENSNPREDMDIARQLFVPSLRQCEQYGISTPLGVLLVWGLNFAAAIHPTQSRMDPFGAFHGFLQSDIAEPQKIVRVSSDALMIFQRGIVPHPLKTELLLLITSLIGSSDLFLQGPIELQSLTIPPFVSPQVVRDLLAQASEASSRQHGHGSGSSGWTPSQNSDPADPSTWPPFEGGYAPGPPIVLSPEQVANIRGGSQFGGVPQPVGSSNYPIYSTIQPTQNSGGIANAAKIGSSIGMGIPIPGTGR